MHRSVSDQNEMYKLFVNKA